MPSMVRSSRGGGTFGEEGGGRKDGKIQACCQSMAGCRACDAEARTLCLVCGERFDEGFGGRSRPQSQCHGGFEVMGERVVCQSLFRFNLLGLSFFGLSFFGLSFFGLSLPSLRGSYGRHEICLN